MGERVKLRVTCGSNFVDLDGSEVFQAKDPYHAFLFSEGVWAGLDAGAPDIVADTARALDETLDDAAGDDELSPGDRVARDYEAMKFLGRVEDDAPATSFRVGDRVEDSEGDRGTVVAAYAGQIDVRYDDPDIGDNGLATGLVPGRDYEFRLVSARPAVTPHPDRPDTADGEVPAGWLEDCFGSVYSPDRSYASYAKEGGYWVVIAPGNAGPYRYVLRSEAIARLQMIPAEGGGS